jgi:hypothetical protein
MPNDNQFIFGRSGVMMDQYEDGFSLLTAHLIRDCGEVSAWSMFAKARREGTNEFYTDLLAGIKSKYKEAFTSYSGDMFSMKEAHQVLPMAPGSQWAGMRLVPSQYNGGNLRLNEISIKVDTPGSYEVFLYRSAANCETSQWEPAPLTSFVINVASAGLTSKYVLPTPLDLPFYIDDSQVNYLLTYELNGAKPYKIKDYCKSCSGSNTPKYALTLTQESAISKTSDPLDSLFNYNHYTNGITIKGILSCHMLGFTCRDWDFNNDAWARVMAYCIMYYSVSSLISYLLDHTRKIDITTIMEREKWYGKRNHARKEASDRLYWLIDNLPKEYVDCVDCTRNAPRKMGLIM